jgi:hypothetical protein
MLKRFWQAVNAAQPERHMQVSSVLCMPAPTPLVIVQRAQAAACGCSTDATLIDQLIDCWFCRVLSWLEHSAGPYQWQHQAHRQGARQCRAG